MNATMRKALVVDAIYQVLDNRVFRILFGTVLLLIFLTFAIGFREDEVVLLFGWKSYTYEQVSQSFGLPIAQGFSEREGLIRLLQTLFVDQVAGNIGVTFAIAATAFFVPRLLEKGLADGLFSKPISRAAFYLACYGTGVGFVAVLALLLVVGMHVGLLVGSGYSDPGFLWGAVTLTYIFAIVHGVSMLIGVLTRSTVAALLLSLVFFMGNGCVHFIWAIKEAEFHRIRTEVDEEHHDDDGPPQALIDGLIVTLDTLHYTLPKTSEAQKITELLREKLTRSAPAFYDPETKLRIQDFGDEFALGPDDDAPARLHMSIANDQARFVRWLKIVDAPDDTRIWIERSRGLSGGRSMSETMEKKLRDTPGVGNVRRAQVWDRNVSARVVEWDEAIGGEPRTELAFITSQDRQLVAFCIDADPSWAPPSKYPNLETPATPSELRREFVTRLLGRAQFDEGDESVFNDNGSPGDRWLRKNFGWTATWKYNAWFSIGTSVAFTVLILALGIWRLRRIDF